MAFLFFFWILCGWWVKTILWHEAVKSLCNCLVKTSSILCCLLFYFWSLVLLCCTEHWTLRINSLFIGLLNTVCFYVVNKKMLNIFVSIFCVNTNVLHEDLTLAPKPTCWYNLCQSPELKNLFCQLTSVEQSKGDVIKYRHNYANIASEKLYRPQRTEI